MSSVLAAGSFKIYFQKGQEDFVKGNIAQALKFYNQALDINSNSAELYNALGEAYFAQDKNVKEAAWYFNTALDIDPQNTDAYQQLGKMYVASSEYGLAEESFKKALEINPNLLGVEYALAWMYVQSNRKPHEAVAYFQKILDKQYIPYAHFGLGLAYIKSGESPMALEVITELKANHNSELAGQLENILHREYNAKERALRLEEYEKQQAMAQQAGFSKGGPPGGVAGGVNSYQGLPITGNMQVRMKGKMSSEVSSGAVFPEE